jgi:hypothetical protein
MTFYDYMARSRFQDNTEKQDTQKKKVNSLISNPINSIIFVVANSAFLFAYKIFALSHNVHYNEHFSWIEKL